jgi:hypothetical protein
VLHRTEPILLAFLVTLIGCGGRAVSSGSSAVDPWVNTESDDEEDNAPPTAVREESVHSDAAAPKAFAPSAPVVPAQAVPTSRVWGSGPWVVRDAGCVTCAEAIDAHGDPRWLCPASIPMFDAVRECACNGVCAHACGTVCSGQPIDVGCYACLTDFHVGCGTIHEACDDQ